MRLKKTSTIKYSILYSRKTWNDLYRDYNTRICPGRLTVNLRIFPGSVLLREYDNRSEDEKCRIVLEMGI